MVSGVAPGVGANRTSLELKDDQMIAEARGNVLFGVTGGIAAYKSPEVVRRLKDRGYRVQVVMTKGATEFITPLTMQAVSGESVRRDLLDEQAESGMGHIELARWADLVLIAPATAHHMSLLAGGHAPDLLSTVCLATGAPIVLAPAMNQQMWQNAATQTNCEVLLKRGIKMVGPGDGSQACGEIGPGRMVDPDQIVGTVESLLEPKVLHGLSMLITAGPTREAIDPVRYISNHSSGKMGYAIAEVASLLGAAVTLISGPTAIPAPGGVDFVSVTTAEEMYDAVMTHAREIDVFLSAAAVADYAPAAAAEQKLKKNSKEMTIELVRTEDILASVAALPRPPFTVGFAAETSAMQANAEKKLAAKAVDMIAANDVSNPAVGFNSEDNALTVLWNGGKRELAIAPKSVIAHELLSLVAERFHVKHPVARS